MFLCPIIPGPPIYVCAGVLLCTAAGLHCRFGWSRGGRGVVTELGMSLGYLTGGLSHLLPCSRLVRCFLYAAVCGQRNDQTCVERDVWHKEDVSVRRLL